jgi:rhamnogalacturonan endolyase
LQNSKVILEVNGMETKLSNGVISIIFDKNAMASSLKRKGIELLSNLNGNIVDSDRNHCFYVDYHKDLKSVNMKPTKLEIVENVSDKAHVKYIDDTSALGVEYHIILKKDDSAVYSYVIAKNNTDREFSINEFRTVYRLDRDLFNIAYNSERTGVQPTSDYTNKFKKLQDETYEMSDGELFSNGKIYSKYDYAGYFRENLFWGEYGEKYGFWFIPASKEYYPSGPLKQELLVHYDSIILNYMTGAHFGTGDFTVPVGWQKIYGPWCIYINDGSNKIDDVKKRAAQEQKSWPYQWVDEELYPLDRATVSGKITISHNRNLPKMTVVLAPPNQRFEKQIAGYIYYTDTNEKGEFTISNVRKGKYSLYAYANEGDITDMLEEKEVVVNSSEVNFNEINWSPPVYDNIWQIGQANRMSSEFKFGNQLRNFKWKSLVPANLTFIIGESIDSEDWYYVQNYKGKWNIQFDLTPLVQKRYYLILALASASKKDASGENLRGIDDPNLWVKLNQQELAKYTLIDDNAIYRCAMKSGTYHRKIIEITTEMLEEGKNNISLSTDGYIMYDTVIFCSI